MVGIVAILIWLLRFDLSPLSYAGNNQVASSYRDIKVDTVMC